MSTIDAARISNLVNQSCQKLSKGTGTASEDIGNDYKIVAETRYSKNPLKRLFGIKRKTVALISLKENRETTIQSFDLTKGKALNEVAENLNRLITKSAKATEGENLQVQAENTQASPLEKFDAACKQAESILGRRQGDKVHKEIIGNFIDALQVIRNESASSQEKEEALEGLKTLIKKSSSNTLISGKFAYSPLSESLIKVMSQQNIDPEINNLRGLCRDMLLGARESIKKQNPKDEATLTALENALQIVDMRKYIELKSKENYNQYDQEQTSFLDRIKAQGSRIQNPSDPQDS